MNKYRAIKDISNNAILLLAVVLTTIVLSFTNFSGISITKYASSMHRVVITAGRPLCIWIVAYCLSWEGFIWLQFVGYFIIVIGMLLYYEVITKSLFQGKDQTDDDSPAILAEKYLSER